MPRIDQNISLGNILNLAALVVAVAVAWGVMTERSKTTEAGMNTLSQALEKESENRRQQSGALESRLRTLESSQARAEERNNSVLQILGRIEARLERIEQGR